MKVITIIGRLTKDGEVRQGKKGEFATFSVAVKDGYGQNERAIYFDIMYWNANLKPSLVKGKEVAVKDLDLTGKIKQITCANADAVGYIYRDDEKTMISFDSMDDIKDKVKEAEEVVEEVSKASKSVKGKVTKTVKKDD